MAMKLTSLSIEMKVNYLCHFGGYFLKGQLSFSSSPFFILLCGRWTLMVGAQAAIMNHEVEPHPKGGQDPDTMKLICKT